LETIKGYVEHIIYQNETNGYTVLVLTAESEEITCVGMLRGVDEGESLEVRGDFTEHALYGRQFRAEAFRVTPPEDVIGMERYLGSGAIRGVGAALAARIIKMFGKDTFRIMEEEPERLAEVKGISERMAREIGVQAEEKRELRDAVLFLQKYGISGTFAARIHETYGMGLYGILRENPYKLAEDISGIGFKKADEIAAKAGIRIDSEYRMQSGLFYTLKEAAGEGHSYLPEEKLLEKAAELLGVQEEVLVGQLENLAIEKKIILKKEEEKKLAYVSSFYYAEMRCARMLIDLNRAMEAEGSITPAEENARLGKIRALEQMQKIELDELQRQAILESLRHGVLILSGGPGTGKTTTINVMIRYFEQEGLDILLAAPTGRAAKRMTEATGYEAKTIHRMLELNGSISEEAGGRGAKFEKNEENPLEADVVIVDEMSMVDLFLLQALLRAVMQGTRLILMGDKDQLPSVGPGQVLHDLIKSNAFPTIILKKIFRQAGESDIVVNAHRIQEGKSIALDNKSKDFFFLERNDVNVIYKHIVQLVQDMLPRYVQASPADIQVLTPMKKGSLGVEALNRALQQYLNPPEPGKKEHAAGSENVFRVGDKVMQIKNNYQLEWEIVSEYNIVIDKGIGIFNGDMGIIREINDFASALVVEFDEHRRVTYPFAGLEELELAYAVTIHKSQGSEYPAVVMPILSGPRLLLNRNLLYTAVTRARNCVTILGSSLTLQEMIDNSGENRRYTSLDKRICEVAAI
jgi:exodeoxyribonuclease V alpha subunit